MLAFRIRLNRKKIVTAGIPGTHVVSAIVTSVTRDKEARRNMAAGYPVLAEGPNA